MLYYLVVKERSHVNFRKARAERSHAVKPHARILPAVIAAVLAVAASAYADGNAFLGREVKVSRDFGFDASDSTRFLQAALSSGAAKVVVDLQQSDWVVTSLTGAPNQKVVFENGVVVRAKPGEFKYGKACLLNYVGCTNVVLSGYGATLKMDRAAYAKPPYEKSEHRHALNIRGGRNIRVEGLTITESGGDGVYLAALTRGKGDSQPPKDVVLKDVKCVRNYRQGLSVISVNGLLCDNCDFSETAGTPPAAGIDFEPNQPHEELQNIVVKNCRFENNKGRGFEFYLGHFNSSTAPVTARFENCVVRGNVNGFAYMQRRSNFNDLPVGGKVELAGCTFERTSRAGIMIIDKPASSASISFRDCRLIDCCTVATNGPDVQISNRLWDTPKVGGVDFGNLEIRQPFPRLKFSDQGEDWLAPGVMPARLDAPRFKDVAVVDAAPGEMRKMDAVCPVGIVALTVCADRPRRVRLRVQMVRMYSNRRIVPGKVELWADGTPIKARFPKVAEEPVELSFKSKSAGLYTLKIDAGRHAVRVIEADAPVAVRIDNHPRAFAATPGSVWFHTDAGRRFAFIAGPDSGNTAAVRLVAPSGETAWVCKPVAKWDRHIPASVPEGLWRADIMRTKKKSRTVFIDAPGADAFLFLSPDRYWKRVGVAR